MREIRKVVSMLVVCVVLVGLVAGPAQAAISLQPALEQVLFKAFGQDTGVLEYTTVKELPPGYSIAGQIVMLFHVYIVSVWEGTDMMAVPLVLSPEGKAYAMIPLPGSNERYGKDIVVYTTPSWWGDFPHTIQVKMASKTDSSTLITVKAALVPLADLKPINHPYLHPFTVYELPKTVNVSGGIY